MPSSLWKSNSIQKARWALCECNLTVDISFHVSGDQEIVWTFGENYTMPPRRIIKTEMGYANSPCEVMLTSQCDSVAIYKHANTHLLKPCFTKD